MPHRYNPHERQVLDALAEYHGNVEQVATVLRVPSRWVQRLAQQRELDTDRSGPHSDEMKLHSPYGDYWRTLFPDMGKPTPAPVAADPVQPHYHPTRHASLVPDDRSDEGFDSLMGAVIGGIQTEAQRGRRGAA